MTTDEQQVKHLEMIQGVVDRLAGNSFSMKGWSITLVSALFALAAKDSNVRYAALALLPALCFWGLDAYYLRQERLFRRLYDAVRKTIANDDAGAGQPAHAEVQHRHLDLFSMNTSAYVTSVQRWARTLFSKSVIWLHAPIVAAVLAVTIYAGRPLLHADNGTASQKPAAVTGSERPSPAPSKR